MKFIIRLLIVLMGVVLFLAMGHILQNWEDFFPQNDATAFSEAQNISNHTGNTVEPSDQSTVLEDPSLEGTMDSFETDSEAETLNDLDASHNLPPSPESETAPSLNFEMTPLDHHSLDHVDNMISLLEAFFSTPDTDYDGLHQKLYLENFFHIEEELKNKNPAVRDAIISHLEYLESFDSKSPDELVESLQFLKAILINLSHVE